MTTQEVEDVMAIDTDERMAPLGARALELDEADALAPFKSRFLSAEPGLIYADGNSLGRMPATTTELADRVLRQEWGAGLIRSWSSWVDLPLVVGDLLAARVLGAGPGEVLVADSTTVNLYKLAFAAASLAPGRRRILIEADNFPTDHYVLSGIARERGLELVEMPVDLDEGLGLETLEEFFDEDTAFACLSAVSYRSGARIDMAQANAIAAAAGSRIIWDLSHAGGSIEVDLAGTGSELAIGCTYKYLNAGPGAPAYLYVRSDLIPVMQSPVRGWFSQAEQFEMESAYNPRAGIGRFGAGTPNILGTALVAQGAELIGEAGIRSLEAKGAALTGLFIEAADALLAPHGFRVCSPRDASRRGSHVTLGHPRARSVTRTLIEEARVVPDFRTPDRIRFGLAPLYTSHAEVVEIAARIAKLAEAGRL
ncbi:MAG: aminotransferase class V-fold PLP-dependent enzyme [Actinomycetota bacterium]|nr:aminotransferase class V-fold PLP-dependent enzyme [Actinomycetota bacterium]